MVIQNVFLFPRSVIFCKKLEKIDVRLSEAEFGMHLSALQYIGIFSPLFWFGKGLFSTCYLIEFHAA